MKTRTRSTERLMQDAASANLRAKVEGTVVLPTGPNPNSFSTGGGTPPCPNCGAAIDRTGNVWSCSGCGYSNTNPPGFHLFSQ